VITTFGSSSAHPITGTFFTEGTENGERLVAAVLWRQLFADPNPPPPAKLDSGLEGGWSSAAGYGRHRVRHSARRRVVGILDLEFELPTNGDTLVLLVEDRPDDDVPSVTVTSMPTPVATYVRRHDATISKEERTKIITENGRTATAAWNAAVRAQPDVVRFLARA
jgi:hypothetical protein